MRPVWVLPVAALVLAPYGAWAQHNPVGPEFHINTYTTHIQDYSSVAASADNFVVVWHSYKQDGSSYGVYGQRYASTGLPLGPEFRVNTYTTDRQYRPSVAADSAGNFVVVWYSLYQDGAQFGVFGQRYAGSGAPLGPEFRVNTHTTGTQRDPSVSADASGNFVVVWDGIGSGDANGGVFAQRYANSGAPVGAEFRVNTYVSSGQRRASVAADPLGNFVVVWEGAGQDGYSNVYGQRYASTGTPLGPEFRVNTLTTGEQGRPHVAFDPSGGFVVSWASTLGGAGAGVFAQRFSSTGAPLGTELRVNAFTGAPQGAPAVAVDSSGNFVVVWWTPAGAFSWDVLGQLYKNTGDPIGPNFVVNAYTTSLQAHPTVAAFPSGHFVVVWESFDQEGYLSLQGVFGQRFDSMTVPVKLMHFQLE